MKSKSQLSVSITPESLYEFGRKRIIDLKYATEEQMQAQANKGWSTYVQRLIEYDQQLDLLAELINPRPAKNGLTPSEKRALKRLQHKGRQ